MDLAIATCSTSSGMGEVSCPVNVFSMFCNTQYPAITSVFYGFSFQWQMAPNNPGLSLSKGSTQWPLKVAPSCNNSMVLYCASNFHKACRYFPLQVFIPLLIGGYFETDGQADRACFASSENQGKYIITTFSGMFAIQRSLIWLFLFDHTNMIF